MVTDSGYHVLMQPLLEKERNLSSELDAVRAAIEALRVAAEANVPAGPAIPPEKNYEQQMVNPLFEGMSVSDRVYNTIQMAGRPLVARGILNILQEQGVAPRNKGAVQKVQAALNGRASKFADIVHIGDGKWGLSKWYTDTEQQTPETEKSIVSAPRMVLPPTRLTVALWANGISLRITLSA